MSHALAATLPAVRDVPDVLGREEAPDRRRAGTGAGHATVQTLQGPRDDVRVRVPSLTCGICTGGVRLFTGVRYGRPIIDWKHTSVPPGTQPHRPVLGTPVDAETLERVHGKKAEPEAKAPKAQPKLVHLVPATTDMLLQSQSISAVLKLADLEGWDVVSKQYGERTDGVEYLIVKLRRHDLAAVAVWKTKDDSWVFDDGWALDRRGIRQVTSTSLKTWIRTRAEWCPDCGLSSVVHNEGECP